MGDYGPQRILFALSVLAFLAMLFGIGCAEPEPERYTFRTPDGALPITLELWESVDCPGVRTPCWRFALTYPGRFVLVSGTDTTVFYFPEYGPPARRVPGSSATVATCRVVVELLDVDGFPVLERFAGYQTYRTETTETGDVRQLGYVAQSVYIDPSRWDRLTGADEPCREVVP